MQASAETEYNLAKEEKNKVMRLIDVSFDGLYMTHGHTSKVGVATQIGVRQAKLLTQTQKVNLANPETSKTKTQW